MFQKRFLINSALAAVALSGGILAGCKGDDKAGTGGSTGGGAVAAVENGGVEVLRGRPDVEVTGPAVEGDVIKIGLVASQNGPLVPWGKDCIDGAQLAINKINAAGGINGMRVQLLVEDSQSTPEGGKSAAEKLVSDGVVAILGEVSSGITQPMTQVSYENGLPHLAVGATKTTITDYGSNVFRVCYTDDFQGPVMAMFAYEEMGVRKIAIMTDEKQPYSQYLSKTFRNYFVNVLGGEVVAEESYESGHTNFTGQLSNIKSKNPEGVFLSGYFNEVGPIVRQAGQAGFENVKYFGGDGWDSAELIEGGGSEIIGGFFCNHYNEHEDRAVVQQFLTDWRASHDGANPGTTMGALGYDAAALMMDAIGRAVTMDGPGIIAALEDTVNFDGVSGSITLKGKNGDPAKQALIVRVEKDGFRAVSTIQYEDIYPSN